MFNKYTPPFTIEKEDITISVEKENGNLVYKRVLNGDDTVEKILLHNGCEFLINPIEPVNIPKALSSFLLIEFQRPVMIAPYEKQTVHLKFPVEIGIFVSRKRGEHELIDILTLAPSKFTLYGDPNRGVICKYWESEVHSSYPHPDILREGDLELEIINDTNNWMELTRAVFNAYGMKIYYGSDRISMRAQMKIINKSLAETEFQTYALSPGFHRSVELYTSRKILLNSTKSIMEFGL
ncbi:DUF432 domain-containing protein [Methanolobus halotolerans]|uniref:DUF432 domain-containing protein n=1 Tax=Methanolobus halotolerans TaxID=2052935 RepID=A0A4E0Q0H9_9EURY|nr:DUF432 domain-containing protein [Methanolobus halotolerans]TGC11537.1 hypothetical protein CUN85_01320 [Methanolobus halotolerans]